MRIAQTYWKHLLQAVFQGRRWLLAWDVLAGASYTAGELEELGAESVFLVGAGRGQGAIRTERALHLDNQAATIMDAIRQAIHLLRTLPDSVVAQLDAWDPDRSARVLTPIFDDGRDVAGRRVYGARPTTWQALEDKTIVDALWKEVGVPHAPYRIGSVDALEEIWPNFDEGHGVVCSGDSRSGFNGGAEYVRWARTPEELQEAKAFFTERCDKIRVMPFLEGIPCSIHGIVFPDFVAALRPMEMLVFRREQTPPAFLYASASSVWDPPEADREQMRSIARKVGAHLRATRGYRGAFTIDGVMTTTGFRPTELNPRIGAAMGVINASMKELPLYLLNCALVEGADLDWRAEDLEEMLVEAADNDRVLRAGISIQRRPEEAQTLLFRLEGTAAIADPAGPGRCTWGPGPIGGYLRILVDPPPAAGPSGAPPLLSAIRLADAHWNLDLGPLSHAVDVRQGTIAP